jgi:hypothetical protein
MALQALQSIHKFDASSLAQSRSVGPGLECEDGLEMPNEMLAAGIQRGSSLACFAGIRVAIAVELLAAMLIYGLWRMIH